MSKKVCKHIIIPISLWQTESLSVLEKWVLLSIDSFSQGEGVAIGVRAIASDTNLPEKTVREILKELHRKGAIEVTIGENGEKLLTALLYRDNYLPQGDKPIVGDKPIDANPIDWEEVSEKWKEYCKELPEISRWTPNRKQKMRGAMKQAGIKLQDLYKVFAIIGATPFLCGQNDRGWQATFDWVIGKSMNITKILEGQYSHSIAEKREYERIMNGEAKQSQQPDNFYR